MKKVVLFLLLSISIFADWGTVNYTDEFGDEKKENYLISYENENSNVYLNITKVKTNFLKREKNGKITKTKELKLQHLVSFNFENYIGTFQDNFNEVQVKIKNDKEEILTLNAYTARDGYGLIIKNENTQKIIDFIKKSENIKLAFKDFEGYDYLFSFEVGGYVVVEKELITVVTKY